MDPKRVVPGYDRMGQGFGALELSEVREEMDARYGRSETLWAIARKPGG